MVTTIDSFLWSEGRLRRRYRLAGPDGEELGDYDLGFGRGSFSATDGTTWEFRTDRAVSTAAAADGRTIVIGTGDAPAERLTVAGRHFDFRIDRRAGRTAQLRDADGTVVLDACDPGWKDGPMRAIAVARTVPEHRGVAALIGFVLAYEWEHLRAAAMVGGPGAA